MGRWLGAIALCALIGCAAPDQGSYELLVGRFNAQHVGRGLDAYSHGEVSDHAMAYGLVASADARWYVRTGDETALVRAVAAADWLIENQDVDGDGVPGWGLSFAWDAFSDGKTNPVGWPYTITSAVAIQGLLDVHEVTGDPALVDVALEVAHVLVRRAFMHGDGEAWFHYSPAPHDAHAVYNVSAMMLGPLQRLAAFEPSFAESADLVVTHLLRAQQVDEHGWIHWLYSAPGAPSSNRPNDLVHAAHIVQGLADYARYGGNVDVDVQALYESLDAFLVEGAVRELPNSEQPARDWGVGAALYTAAIIEQDLGVQGDLSKHFYEAATTYRPRRDRLYPRQAGHILLGLSVTAPVPPGSTRQALRCLLL